jgi:2-polyprenyl-6-methoxyphenol hydroxylase-like FAD-dependent oxidoreductase
MTSVLISGASIAGLTLAYWLRESGFAVTVIERSPGFRPGGQAVDLRGVAVEVVDRMGLAPALKERRLPAQGMTMLGVSGEELSRTDTMTLTGGIFADDEIEVLRDDLVGLLVQGIAAGVEFIFSDTVVTVREDEGGVAITTLSGRHRRFDLLVGADGMYSNIRQICFGPHPKYFRPTGMCVVNFTTPNILGLDAWQFACWEGDVRYIVYPARENRELRVFLLFGTDNGGNGLRDPGTQRRIAVEHCGALSWRMPELVSPLMTTDDFYFGEVGQIKMNRWWGGRIALTGDAAYCPSPLTGQGSSLAVIGAYVLAAELRRFPGDHRQAFERYDDRMRPFVEINQQLLRQLDTTEPDFAPIAQVKNAFHLDA